MNKDDNDTTIPRLRVREPSCPSCVQVEISQVSLNKTKHNASRIIFVAPLLGHCPQCLGVRPGRCHAMTLAKNVCTHAELLHICTFAHFVSQGCKHPRTLCVQRYETFSKPPKKTPKKLTRLNRSVDSAHSIS